MLERILQGLHDVEGVQATMVFDSQGNILAAQAHSVYDGDLLQQVSRSIVSAIDSVALVQEDWELVTASFAEGKVLIRNVRLTGKHARSYTLAVVADARLNPSFANVAIRVAASKLRTELDSATSSAVMQAVSPQPVSHVMPHVTSSSVLPPLPPRGQAPVTMQPSVRPMTHSPMGPPGASAVLPPARQDLSSSGLSWSGVSRPATNPGPSPAPHPAGQSGIATSGVSVADNAASAFLSVATKALSASVGPMAKVFIKEGVRKLCGGRPFTREDAPALIAELEVHISDAADLAQFRKALEYA